MSSSENIAGELQEISALVAGIGNANVYEVPANYFDPLAQSILDRINESADQGTKEELSRISTLLSDVPNTLPYDLPPTYFSDLADDVISGARAIDFVNQELEIESSLLHHAERKNVYTVPGGYFFKLPYTILQKVKAGESKVSILSKYKKILSFAAAAVFAGAMSVASWSYFHQSLKNNNNTSVVGIEKIGADEISSYLENNAPVSSTDTAAFSIADLKTDEIKLLLADVSNEELENYIDLNSGSKNLGRD